MKHLPAGQLKTKTWFQSKSESDDGHNEESWSDEFYKMTKIETGIAKEVEQSGQVMGEVTHSIKCHYSNKVNASQRIRIKANYYQIIGKPINVNLENRVTIILVKELTDA